MRLPRPRTRLQWASAVAGGLLLFGAAFWLIAPYNIAASIPHAPGVRPLLHGYMQNAVRTWSLGLEPPDYIDLDDPALAALGAGHFENGCAPCHGAPGRPRNPVVRGMRPEPPDLAEAVRHYEDRELYWIVLNGLKYTGMPAWPAQTRPEEPWALAAFLRRYGEIDGDAYRELAFGPAGSADAQYGSSAVPFGTLHGRGAALLETCARCHGEDGMGRDGVAPRLAGQSRAYLLETLNAFADGTRPSGFMQPLAAALSPSEREQLAEHYAGLPGEAADVDQAEAPETLLEWGARLAHSGDAARDVPSCLACHGEDSATERRDVYPSIAGQDARWLETWLRLWRERRLGGTEYAHLMHQAARTLTDQDIRALSAWFAGIESTRWGGD